MWAGPEVHLGVVNDVGVSNTALSSARGAWYPSVCFLSSRVVVWRYAETWWAVFQTRVVLSTHRAEHRKRRFKLEFIKCLFSGFTVRVVQNTVSKHQEIAYKREGRVTRHRPDPNRVHPLEKSVLLRKRLGRCRDEIPGTSGCFSAGFSFLWRGPEVLPLPGSGTGGEAWQLSYHGGDVHGFE